MSFLPPEVLNEIFNYIKNDYKTLYSCILINKQWHNVSIPTLWRDPFYSVDSIKILINCLLVEDKDFLTKKKIQLQFKLLEKPPLHNYARFSTELSLRHFVEILENLIASPINDKYVYLKKKLVSFVLDYSTIKALRNANLDYRFLTSHHRFNICFQNLYELNCVSFDCPQLIDKLASTCKNIQILKIECNKHNIEIFDYSLTQLIKAQNQIRQLIIINSCSNDFILSKDLRKAILIHSESIISYSSYGKNNLDSLFTAFQNLKLLSLLDSVNIPAKNIMEDLKSIWFPDLEVVNLSFLGHRFLLDLSNFIELNGKNLRKLSICGEPIDKCHLGTLIQSIGHYCQNLESFSIFYRDNLDQQLIQVFNNCFKLKCIKFTTFSHHYERIDGDKILNVLNKTLPKNLNSLVFKHSVTIFDHNSLEALMTNWKGPRPFKIILLINNKIPLRGCLSEKISKSGKFRIISL